MLYYQHVTVFIARTDAAFLFCWKRKMKVYMECAHDASITAISEILYFHPCHLVRQFPVAPYCHFQSVNTMSDRKVSEKRAVMHDTWVTVIRYRSDYRPNSSNMACGETCLLYNYLTGRCWVSLVLNKNSATINRNCECFLFVLVFATFIGAFMLERYVLPPVICTEFHFSLK